MQAREAGRSARPSSRWVDGAHRGIALGPGRVRHLLLRRLGLDAVPQDRFGQAASPLRMSRTASRMDDTVAPVDLGLAPEAKGKT